MSKTLDPSITPWKSGDGGEFTRVSFSPHLPSFSLGGVGEVEEMGLIDLMKTRVVDVSGTASPINVYLNGGFLVINYLYL